MSNEQAVMTVREYIVSKGLTVRLVAQQMGVSDKLIYKYGKESTPTAKTLTKIARAMTELGVPTTVVELFGATNNESYSN